MLLMLLLVTVFLGLLDLVGVQKCDDTFLSCAVTPPSPYVIL